MTNWHCNGRVANSTYLDPAPLCYYARLLWRSGSKATTHDSFFGVAKKQPRVSPWFFISQKPTTPPGKAHIEVLHFPNSLPAGIHPSLPPAPSARSHRQSHGHSRSTLARHRPGPLALRAARWSGLEEKTQPYSEKGRG